MIVQSYSLFSSLLARYQAALLKFGLVLSHNWTPTSFLDNLLTLPLQRPDATSPVAPRAKAPPGTVRPLRSRSGSSPRGTENNGRERPAPPPRSLATENGPWKLCFPIGEYGPSLAAGGRLGRRHCGRCSPHEPTATSGQGAEFGDLITCAVREEPRRENPPTGSQGPRPVTWDRSLHFFMSSK